MKICTYCHSLRTGRFDGETTFAALLLVGWGADGWSAIGAVVAITDGAVRGMILADHPCSGIFSGGQGCSSALMGFTTAGGAWEKAIVWPCPPSTKAVLVIVVADGLAAAESGITTTALFCAGTVCCEVAWVAWGLNTKSSTCWPLSFPILDPWDSPFSAVFTRLLCCATDEIRSRPLLYSCVVGEKNLGSVGDLSAAAACSRSDGRPYVMRFAGGFTLGPDGVPSSDELAILSKDVLWRGSTWSSVTGFPRLFNSWPFVQNWRCESRATRLGSRGGMRSTSIK